ncbi:MAG: CotH kinase family protein [Bacteroidetes bacterium]|nr:CotH kinase family protein [Bacteroidota bacterium]MDA1335890.1 CotH kinase family protein [Bacteroidota bacterium]
MINCGKHIWWFTLASLMWSSDARSQWIGINQHPGEDTAFLSEEITTIHIQCGDAIEWMWLEDNLESNVEHPATFIHESSLGNDTIENVGFRLRGNTSRYAPKKSFKISFDSFNENGQWQGLEKLNLNGEHNDPSTIRARLCWELLRDAGIPVSRSQHSNLYINGAYYGVYSNTEHIDGEWLEKRFEHAHGNLWKCTYPSDLDYISDNPDDYKFTPSWSNQRVYELKTNRWADDYSALATFIDILNNTAIESLPCELEAIFDVDAYLKTAAAEILTGHWDNYIGNKNNFYLYQRSTDGRIIYIPYDMDNTLGIQWFGEWTDQDPYAWTTSSNRPLYTRLLAVPEYRARFSWYLSWWMENEYSSEWIEGRSAWLIDLLDEHIEIDPFYPLSYGFDSEDFMESDQNAWGSHVAHSPVDFVSSRLFWTEVQLEDGWEDAKPIIQCWAEGPITNDSLCVQCWIPQNSLNDEWEVTVELLLNEEIQQHSLEPVGTNIHGQEWSVIVGLNGAEDALWRAAAQNGTGNLQYSPCEFAHIWNGWASDALLINEVMPKNDGFVFDEYENDGDWIELFNAGNDPINVQSYFLTNRIMEPNRWQLPNVTLDPGQHLLLWSDDLEENGPLHTTFTLDAADDQVYLTKIEDDAWRIVDAIDWTLASGNQSLGRSSDGASDWVWFQSGTSNPPTPNSANGNGTVNVTHHPASVLNDWRPASPCIQPCELTLPEKATWKLFDTNGREVLFTTHTNLAINGLEPGLYFLYFNSTSAVLERTFKIIIQ